MGYDKVTIFNLALSACGVDIGVAEPDERSREASVCRLWYSQTTRMVMAAAPWPSIRRYARLAFINERAREDTWTAADASPFFARLYATPSNLLHPYHLSTFERFEYFSGTLSTDAETPILYYNAHVEDSTLWDQGLTDAVVYALAARIARPITGSAGIVSENYQLAANVVENAQVAAANYNEDETDSLPDWLQARGTDLRTPARFLYPFQRLSVESAA